MKTGKNPIMQVYILGSGGPEYTPDRFGIGTLVVIKDKSYLFDVGRGVAQRIYECGLSFDLINQIFLTHLHSDHIEGLPNLWMTPWFLFAKTKPLSLCGPVGSKAMVAGMKAMFEKDYHDRSNEIFRQEALDMTVTEFESEGIVFDEDGVVVSVFPVEHAEGNPAFGYCLEYENNHVVLSGDTTYHTNVVEYGKGARLIVHNVIAVKEELEESFRPVIEKLTTPEQAAEVFKQAEPDAAVLSHICKKGLSGHNGDKIIYERVRAAGYDGKLAVGRDRMRIDIYEDSVEIIEPNSLKDMADLQ